MAQMTNIDFQDTAVAFRSRSPWELQRARLLFKAFEFPWLVSYGPHLATKVMDWGVPVAPLIRHTLFAQFCGGVTLEDSRAAVDRLGQSQIRSVLDYAVEGLGREEDFDATLREMLRSIAFAADCPHVSFAVFKMTGLAPFDLLEKVAAGGILSRDEAAAWERASRRFGQITQAAADAGIRIMVDAEETWIQGAIDGLVHEAMARLNRSRPVIYNTVQMYCRDRLPYLEELDRRGREQGFVPGVKLVRGAYMEKERQRAAQRSLPSPIQPDKGATDRDYDAALALIVGRIERFALFAGTHNESSCRTLAQLMADRGLAPGHPWVEFSQLLGMSDHISYNLAHHGYNVSKYVPYGPVRAVMPYLARRAAENSAIRGQAGREMQLLERELKRRRVR